MFGGNVSDLQLQPIIASWQWAGRVWGGRLKLTSRWNLSRVSFLCIWSWTQALAQYSPSNSEDQQFPASLLVFIKMILIRHLSSEDEKKEEKKKEEGGYMSFFFESLSPYDEWKGLKWFLSGVWLTQCPRSLVGHSCVKQLSLAESKKKS